jgi:methionine synthase II (cobalamin-independent)
LGLQRERYINLVSHTFRRGIYSAQLLLFFPFDKSDTSSIVESFFSHLKMGKFGSNWTVFDVAQNASSTDSEQWESAATLGGAASISLWSVHLTEKYYKIADTLVDKLGQAYRDQATDLQKCLVKFIDEYYVPDEGEPKPSAEATKLVARSITKDMLAYMFAEMKENKKVFHLQRTPKNFSVEGQVGEAVKASGIWIPNSTLKAMEKAVKDKVSPGSIAQCLTDWLSTN